MATVTVRVQAEGRTEAESGHLTAELQRLIRNGIPEAGLAVEKTDRETMEAGSLLVVALSHIALTAFIEIVKAYWELHPGAKVKIQSKDGTTLSFQGLSREFEQTIKKLADAIVEPRP